MQKYEVIIVGAGPSGCASALQLARLDPSITAKVLVLDKAVFPRPKLCAGGLSPDADAALAQLGVDVNVPAIAVHKTRFVLPTGELTFELESQFRVIRREHFDYELSQSAVQRGVVMRDGETVKGVRLMRDEVIVETNVTEYRTQILIAADGANSSVRRELKLGRAGRLMVAMELHALTETIAKAEPLSNVAVLDLRPLVEGVAGYCWIFPAVNATEELSSLGIFAAPPATDQFGPVKQAFTAWLASLGLHSDAFEIKAHPILRYDPKAACSHNRVLFVGDAAGADPLFGEGISSALALGSIAAQSAFEALKLRDFSFREYEKRIRSSEIGSMMRRRMMIARRLYSHPKLAGHFLKHGKLFRGISLLAVPPGGKLTWLPANA